MVSDANWLLPEGVEEILPAEALKLEQLRRAILDDLQGRDFQLVMPPVMEFVDALLTGTGEELDTQTYKFMDQNSHRMLGIRADMTPQIARIDAHYLADQDVNRLCYAGTVLRTQPEEMGGQRELLQIGAELFGVADESADIEIIDAMLQCLALSCQSQVTLSLGHVGIYRALLEAQEAHDRALTASQISQLFDVLLRKSSPDLQAMSDVIDTSQFDILLQLQGGPEVIEEASSSLTGEAEIGQCLAQLQAVVAHLQSAHPEVQIHIDLADVFGYRYHTGLKFSAYVAERGRTVAKGGRYDRIGEQFGRARPATGFSADLKTLVKLA
ncbi:MAG: ATP phosphoribosyltransferase regulatory subunit [Gammaproteobacteria bacterium]|nr:ATP phosphoribosyltransferase regulatory subunit [Gammaproteobacteria bacterium]